MNHLRKIILIVLIFGALFASAWQGPTTTPPDGNVNTLLNTSNETQTKAGYLYFPKWFDSDDDEYYVDPDANSIFARIYANLDMRAPKFFDLDDSDYYVDPASTSRVNSIVGTGTICDKNGCIGDSAPAVDLCEDVSCDDYCDLDDATRYYNGSCSSVDGSCLYISSKTCLYGCSSGVCDSCSDTSWTPPTSYYCSGASFVQTSNCGTKQYAVGTAYCCVPGEYQENELCYGDGHIWQNNGCFWVQTYDCISEQCADAHSCVPTVSCTGDECPYPYGADIGGGSCTSSIFQQGSWQCVAVPDPMASQNSLCDTYNVWLCQ